MLTGDKLETATCTAKNAHLITRSQDVHIFRPVSEQQETLALCACDVGNSYFATVLISVLFSWLCQPIGNWPLWSGPFCGHTAPMTATEQPASLNNSPPTSESIQATVKEHKQPFAQTEGRNQLDLSQRKYAKGAPFLICLADFRLSSCFDIPLLLPLWNHAREEEPLVI